MTNTAYFFRPRIRSSTVSYHAQMVCPLYARCSQRARSVLNIQSECNLSKSIPEKLFISSSIRGPKKRLIQSSSSCRTEAQFIREVLSMIFGLILSVTMAAALLVYLVIATSPPERQ